MTIRGARDKGTAHQMRREKRYPPAALAGHAGTLSRAVGESFIGRSPSTPPLPPAFFSTVFTSVHTRARTREHTDTQTQTQTHTHSLTHSHAHTHTRTRTHMHAHTHKDTHTHTHTLSQRLIALMVGNVRNDVDDDDDGHDR